MSSKGTLTVRLSEAVISENMANSEYSQFRDPRYPLYLRVHGCRTSGSWYLRDFSKKSGQDWHHLGRWPLIPVKVMLNKAPENMARLGVGAMPELTFFQTVGDVLKWFKKRCQTDTSLSKKRRAGIESSLGKHLIPRLANEPLVSFDKSALEDLLLWPLQEVYQPGTVRQHFQILKRAFSQAVKSGKATSSPLEGIQFKDVVTAKIKAKPCAIARQDEPQMAHTVLNAKGIGGVLCQMLLLHGTRIGETLLLKWSDIDSKHKTLTLPEEITKTKEHKLLLSDFAFELLVSWHKELKAAGYRGKYLFPDTNKKGPLSYAEARKLVLAMSQGKYTAHDYRKLFRARALELGIDSMVAELMLNHELTPVQKTYVESLGADVGEGQRRAAWTLWATHLQEAAAEFKDGTEANIYQFA